MIGDAEGEGSVGQNVQETFTRTQADQAVALVSTKREIVRQRLVISEPYHVDMLAAPWSDLLAGNGYQNSTGAPLHQRAFAGCAGGAAHDQSQGFCRAVRRAAQADFDRMGAAFTSGRIRRRHCI